MKCNTKTMYNNNYVNNSMEYGKNMLQLHIKGISNVTLYKYSGFEDPRSRVTIRPFVLKRYAPTAFVHIRNLTMCKFMYGERWFVNALHYTLRHCQS